MAVVTATTTEAELGVLYNTHVGYEEDGSLAGAKSFITVLRAMLKYGKRAMEIDGQRVEMDPGTLMTLMTDARRYVAINSGRSRIRHADLSDIRWGGG